MHFSYISQCDIFKTYIISQPYTTYEHPAAFQDTYDP